ncbi:hypothetical protein D3C80_1667130 [compost metagenome]
MEYRSRQRAVNVGIAEGFQEVFHGTGTAGGDQWHLAHLTYPLQLFQIVTVAYAILVHHVEHNLPSATLLHFLHPI